MAYGRQSEAEAAPAIDAGRVLADLRELDERTGGPGGARRVCWSAEWRRARELLAERLGELGLQPRRDPAGNLWARLEGSAAGAEAVAVGSHLDSVAAGGWLDGALGVMAALGALRAWSEAGEPPPRDLLLVDWADEEGSRFGRSLFGSSAFAGRLDVAAVAGLRDAEGSSISDALAENGLDLERVPLAAERRPALAAYLELHIEQGPVLESEGVAAAAVRGCAGVERHRLRFAGQSSHAGTTPMSSRHDAGLAAAETMLAAERVALEHGGVATCGGLELSPGAVTIVPGGAELLVDLRHPEPGALAAMLAETLAAGERAASERGCELGQPEPLFQIEPVAFDPELVDVARQAVAARGGRERPLTSGALHDAAEVARLAPVAMIFSSSLGGLSHHRDEDTPEPHLRLAIEAYGETVNAALGA